MVPNQGTAVVFDADAASLASLREALPGWEVRVVRGASAGVLARDWNPGAADFLVVSAREDAAATLGLCRFLAFCTSLSSDSRQEGAGTSGARNDLPDRGRRADAPLLVLVPPGQEALVRAALEAGAHGCLVLPIHPPEVASLLAHVRAGNQPGRHTLNLDRAQTEDPWRDDGGEG